MNRFQVMLLTAFILLLAFRPGPLLAGVPVVCNDGRIPVSVARAFRDEDLGTAASRTWSIQGWYVVDPGNCSEIGPDNDYASPIFGDQAVTFLAFAFTDSTGVWGAARVPEPGIRESGSDAFTSADQQICVRTDGDFHYMRSTSQGDPAKECDRGRPGYNRIPASLQYNGDYDESFPEDYTLHVGFGPGDRAIPLGSQGSARGSNNTSAPKPGNPPPAKPSGDAPSDYDPFGPGGVITPPER
jgi:hypothetical protein